MCFISFNHDRDVGRFSLLLLEPGEIYFEDFSVYYFPDGDIDTHAPHRQQQGHLKVCSKSVVFVPKQIQWPIIKFPMRNVEKIEEHEPGLLSKAKHVLKIVSNQHVKMKAKNIVAPFFFEKVRKEHLFTLNYASVDDAVGPMCQIHRASTLMPSEQEVMINAIVLSRQSRVQFNTSWLEDLYETILLEARADRITPLATNPGRLMLTSSRLYFQPFNNIDKWPVLKIHISRIKGVRQRRFLLRQIGLEFECRDGAPVNHLYLALKTRYSRDEFYTALLQQKDLQLEEERQEDMTLRWQSGVCTNYDYLLYLNSLADRSFSDLTQYPVMPWVIQDYTSPVLDLENEATFRDLTKPIGALNTERLNRLKECSEYLPEPKYLFGSHYSNPGYILFFLARMAPEYVLCLQNGKFDSPDRMFNSVQDMWQNCLTGSTDFKELIPEFYHGSGDFLVHRGVVKFGQRNDGRPVENVALPPWATDAQDFISKLRGALECDYVSQRLHHWIDLIFGYKQRGEEAEKADNVFHYMTYEGAVDLESIQDPNELKIKETQIMEFGQTPKQLFLTPHPQRKAPTSLSPSLLALTLMTTNGGEKKGASLGVGLEGGDMPRPDSEQEEIAAGDNSGVSVKNFSQLSTQYEYTLHKNTVSEVHMSSDEKSILSVSQDGLLKMYCIEEQRQLRSVNLSSMVLSSCVVLPGNQTIVVGSWDNNVYFYSIEYGHVQDTLQAHDDAVSCMLLYQEHLYTASWDGTVKKWQLTEGQSSVNMTHYRGQMDHEEGVTCMDVYPPTNTLLTGTNDGQLAVWDISCYSLGSQTVHCGKMNACLVCSSQKRVVTCGSDRLLKVIDMETQTELLAKDLQHEVLLVHVLCHPEMDRGCPCYSVICL
ncbi:hypothetical protein ACOMHN_034511 [Nucella lapillus]